MGAKGAVEIIFRGDQVSFANPRAAREAGIETIYQDLALADNLDINGNLTLANGTLTDGAYTLNVAGDWINTGGSLSATGTVILDGSSQTLSGSTTFNHLTKTVTAADTLTFTAGSTQTVTGTLTLQGAAGQLLSLRSSSTGTQWNIDPQGTRTLSYLDVQDSSNVNALNIDARGANVTDSGNNLGWVFDGLANFNRADINFLGCQRPDRRIRVHLMNGRNGNGDAGEAGG